MPHHASIVLLPTMPQCVVSSCLEEEAPLLHDMSPARSLREVVTLRQSAAAEEILQLLERTLAETRHHGSTENHKADPPQASVGSPGPVQQLIVGERVPSEQQREWRTTPDQEDPDPPLIKEEQEEFRCGHEGEQLRGPEEDDVDELPFAAVSVKSDDEEGDAPSSQLRHRQTGRPVKREADEDGGGSEPAGGLRVSVTRRLTAAVEDILGMFETTLAEYERRIEGLRALLEGSVKLDEDVDTSDDPQLLAVKEEGSSQQLRSSLDQEDPDPPLIKEEHEELWSSREGRRLRGPEEGEEEKAQSSHLHRRETDRQMKRESVEDFGGPEPAGTFGPACDSQQESNEKTHSSGRANGDSDDYSQEMSPPQSALVPLTHNEGSVSCDGSDPVGETVNSNLSVGKPFSCSICAKGFSQKSDLKRHLRFHAGERPFSCVFCGKHFTEKADLKRHTRVHTGEKPFSCPVCGKGFSDKTDLTRHVRVHTGEKPFSCSVCGKIFSQNENLRRHERIHTGEKPFCCPVCPKTFTHRGALVVHLRIHTGEKPFGCSLCGKRYSETGNLKKHMRVHAAEKALGCGVCGRRFNFQSQVKTHKCRGESSVTTAGRS